MNTVYLDGKQIAEQRAILARKNQQDTGNDDGR